MLKIATSGRSESSMIRMIQESRSSGSLVVVKDSKSFGQQQFRTNTYLATIPPLASRITRRPLANVAACVVLVAFRHLNSVMSSILVERPPTREVV